MVGQINGEGCCRVTEIHKIDYFRVGMDYKAPKVWEAAALLTKNLQKVVVILLIHRPTCQVIQQIPLMCQASG